MKIKPEVIAAFYTTAVLSDEVLAFAPTMNKGVKNSVDRFIDGTNKSRYQKINDAQRSGKKHSSEQHHIANLDSATKSHKLKSDKTLYRGIKVPHDRFKVGSTYKTKSHTSTTPNAKVAKEFSHSHHSAKSDPNAPHKYHTVLKLHAKKGQEHLHVPSVTKSKDERKQNLIDKEDEHLLPRGTRYKVTHIEESSNPRTKPHIVHAEIVHPKKKTRMEKDG